MRLDCFARRAQYNGHPRLIHLKEGCLSWGCYYVQYQPIRLKEFAEEDACWACNLFLDYWMDRYLTRWSRALFQKTDSAQRIGLSAITAKCISWSISSFIARLDSVSILVLFPDMAARYVTKISNAYSTPVQFRLLLDIFHISFLVLAEDTAILCISVPRSSPYKNLDLLFEQVQTHRFLAVITSTAVSPLAILWCRHSWVSRWSFVQ